MICVYVIERRIVTKDVSDLKLHCLNSLGKMPDLEILSIPLRPFTDLERYNFIIHYGLSITNMFLADSKMKGNNFLPIFF